MTDDIVWKEAKGGRGSHRDSDGVDDEDDGDWASDNQDSFQETEDIYKATRDDENKQEEKENVETYGSSESESDYENPMNTRDNSNRLFPIERLKLKLKRNITALSEACEPNKRGDQSDIEPVLDAIENGLLAISPNADLMLFSCQSPERVVFLAKLRMEPANEYTIKKLEIPLDYDEQITSVFCLPIMSAQRTAVGIVDWTALVFGLSSGYVKFYTEQSICLFTLKFFETPVISIKCQTQKIIASGRSELHFPTMIDGLLVASKSSAVTIDGIGLYENLKISLQDLAKNGSNYEPAYDATNLPVVLTCQRWRYNSLAKDVDTFGTRSTSKFDVLRSNSISFDNIPTKNCPQTIASVGCNPLLTIHREPRDTNAHSVTEILGSLIPFWGKPAVNRIQMNEISNPSNLSFYDKDRSVQSIISSPDKRLAATTDSFGRVMLVDITNNLVIRVWKGYRSAQCGWVEVKRDPDDRSSPYATFLVIYAPKRGILEVWSSQRGPRVAAFNVGKNCRLLYSGYKMLNMRAEIANKLASNANLLIDQSYATNCYLFNIRNETIFSIELPYTYSLYKYGDLKSRDHLLVLELTSAIQQDAEVEFISEIIHRISLAESLQTCIKKIAHNLNPGKIISIQENLMNKIMTKYFDSDELMTEDDIGIIELSKRLIRLCTIFNQLTLSAPNEMTLPEVNQRLIDTYEEHPQEVDEFAEQLGWSATEVLRCLSLASLERSYCERCQLSPWPNLGEPLAWQEFISCFDLNLLDRRSFKKSDTKVPESSDKISIRLHKFSSKFLNEDRVIKTSIFMYNRLSENFYKSTVNASSSEVASQIGDCYNYLDPSSRLALLFQFWLSTKLCNHWKMWAFLQNQVGMVSDELTVISTAQNDDSMVIEAWKQVYNLILESNNLYAALIATATIRSDTIRSLNDDRSKERKLREAERGEEDLQVEGGQDAISSIDWECLLIDAERMSLLGQQLEEVFLLSLLLRYSPADGHLVDRYVYSVPRISLASLLRSGPTIVSELVAQWALQSKVNLKIFTKSYGHQAPLGEDDENEAQQVVIDERRGSRKLLADGRRMYPMKSSHDDNEEHAMELLHHTKTAFPSSLEADVILINCFWLFCRRWTTNRGLAATDRVELLRRAFDCLPLLSCVQLRYKLASLAYKTFFQRTFERLVILVETNGTIMSSKQSRLRDTLTRKELNIGEDCLEIFVQFCCDLSEFMLQAHSESMRLTADEEQTANLEEKLLAIDDWWSSPSTTKSFGDYQLQSENTGDSVGSLCRQIVALDLDDSTLNVDTLVELNKLANLISLIFKLKVAKSFPMSLIGDESRRILRLDLQQSAAASAAAEVAKHRSGPLGELRQKFARKCILAIVSKLSEETSEFSEDDVDDMHDAKSEVIDSNESKQRQPKSKSSERSRAREAGANVKGKTRSSFDVDSPPGPNGAQQVEGEEDDEELLIKDENNESMVLFASLLSLASEWKLERDELYLELVFELYRCNHDKIGAQISHRVHDQETLANGLLKICSQRVLVLYGLSPSVSGGQWRKRSDKWTIFAPNVSSWLKSIQSEEMRRDLAAPSFPDSLKLNNRSHRDESNEGATSVFGLPSFVLRSLRRRTKLVLERVTNHLDGQASRLAYDLLQLLESPSTIECLEEAKQLD